MVILAVSARCAGTSHQGEWEAERKGCAADELWEYHRCGIRLRGDSIQGNTDIGSGLVAGLGISVFSKSLALLIGLLVVGVQTAESYGIHLIPYQRLQGYVKGVDLRSAVQDNVAFKISFGTMFALSAFAEF